MGRNEFLTVIIFLFLIFSDCSDASLGWNFRKLVGLAPKDNSTTTQVSPLPSPDSGGKELNASPVDAAKAGKEKHKETQRSKRSPEVNPKGSNNGNSNNTSSANPPTDKQINKGTNDKGKEKSDERTNSQLDTDGSCESSPNKCVVEKTMVACIQAFESGSKDMVLVVQNERESPLKVNITIPTPMGNSISIAKHKTEKININISFAIGQSTKIVLNAGNGDCVLYTGPSVTEGNFFQQLPSYYKQVTPIYGAYFLFLIALIVGGTWACCKFRKGRRQAGVPYQELEMGLPESASAVNVDTAEGWDQGWDDDWDEERAVKSPGGHHVGNISANGLTSRSSNRDGWENNWDD